MLASGGKGAQLGEQSRSRIGPAVLQRFEFGEQWLHRTLRLGGAVELLPAIQARLGGAEEILQVDGGVPDIRLGGRGHAKKREVHFMISTSTTPHVMSSTLPTA